VRAELEQAITLLRHGDEADITHALTLLQQTLLSFGIKLCGQREDAEDTAQEVLVRTLPHLARLDNPQALSAWLYTAAKNRCWQGRRRATYRKSVALEDLMPGEAEMRSLLVADRGSSPEDQASRRQDHERLHQAVLSLPPQYRIVLVLHDMEELETDLVAKILLLEPGTVRVRLHRARLLVRRDLNRLMHPDAVSSRKSTKSHPSAQCREIFGNLSEYLDGNLPPADCDRMRRHIDACPSCVAFIHDLKRAIDRCRSLDVCSGEQAPAVLKRLITEEYLRLKNSPAVL
jgi:RNA polymerase sigma-70 factor (ECF subfamily)